MSFVSLFGNRAISALSPAFLNSVRMEAIETGCAYIKVNGCRYSVSHVKILDGFCVQSAGRGAPGAFIGRPAWARGESCRPGTDVKPKPEPNKST